MNVQRKNDEKSLLGMMVRLLPAPLLESMANDNERTVNIIFLSLLVALIIIGAYRLMYLLASLLAQ